MAKLLAFNRGTSKAVTLDTINGTIADVGAAIATVDTTSAFDARSRNTTAVFLGDPYTLVRAGSGPVVVAAYKYSSGSWAIAGFWSFTLNGAGSPTVHPVSLQVVNNTLVAVFYETGTIDGIHVRTTTDGASWSVATALGNAAWPDFGVSGATTVWRNTVWASSGEGILGRVISPAAWVGGGVDVGSDSGLNDSLTQQGSFAHWKGDLYFIRPDTTTPRLYKLPSTYSHSSVAAVAGWANQNATGIPVPGSLVVGADSGTYCLFTNTQDELCLWTSSTTGGVKLSKTTAATFPLFTDLTSALVPSTITGLNRQTIGLYEDDRRRTNELHSFVFRGGGSSMLVSWDGTNLAKVVSTHAATLLIPNDQKSDLRTFTDLQPAVKVTAVAQAFPGQATISYTLREASSRKCSISAQYSADGDTWSVMTQGTGGSATSNLTTSPAGVAYTFVWDAYIDLDGSYDYMQMRVVPNISGT